MPSQKHPTHGIDPEGRGFGGLKKDQVPKWRQYGQFSWSWPSPGTILLAREDSTGWHLNIHFLACHTTSTYGPPDELSLLGPGPHALQPSPWTPPHHPQHGAFSLVLLGQVMTLSPQGSTSTLPACSLGLSPLSTSSYKSACRNFFTKSNIAVPKKKGNLLKESWYTKAK